MSLEVQSSEVVQIIVLGAAFPALYRWMLAEGFELNEWTSGEDDLRTFMMTPGLERLPDPVQPYFSGDLEA